MPKWLTTMPIIVGANGGYKTASLLLGLGCLPNSPKADCLSRWRNDRQPK